MPPTRVLIVEDENVVAMDLQARLTRLGYDVPTWFRSAEAALAKLAELAPDVVLMDIILKDKLDGVEAAEQVRQRFGLPVIFVTAHSDENTLQRARITGPFGYILKPFDDRELHTTIEITLYRRAIERQLQASESRFRSLIECSNDVIAILDSDRVIRYASPSALLVLGYRPEEMLGRNLFEFIVPEKAAMIAETIQLLLHQPGTAISVECTVRHCRGSRRTLSGHMTNLLDEPGINGIVVNCHDITDLRQTQDTLQQYNRELQARNEELDTFAHTVAHDLKNPLSVVIGFAEELQVTADQLSADQQQIVRSIIWSGRKVDNILDELMLLAEVRSQTVPVHLLDMAGVVVESVHRLANMIGQSQAEIVEDQPARWPLALGYAPWVEQVWVNYLSNAIQYGGRPPRIELGAARQPDGMVRFWVSDNGPGLSQDEQARLFTPFTRLDQVRARGHGLGLSIVRRIVEKLGGQVGVESQGVAGKGSVFYFTLPADSQVIT